MFSKQFSEGHCDICYIDSLHLQNLPCLKHYACRSCAAKIACFGPSVPEKNLHTCPICVISAAEDIEPYTEDLDPLGIGFTGELGNPRTNTPIYVEPRQQSPTSKQNFLQLASTRLLNEQVDTQPELACTSETRKCTTNTKQDNKTVDRPASEDVKKPSCVKTQAKYLPAPLPAWSATKSDSLDSVGSWRSSPGSLTQGDITDMGIVTLPQRSHVGTYTQGSVVRTEGSLSPRSLLKAQHEMHCRQRQLLKDKVSTLQRLQSESPSPIALNVNVLDPNDTSSTDEDNPAARYLFEDDKSENKQEKSKFFGPQRKKGLRGMAGPITPGAAQKVNSPKRSVVAIPKPQKVPV